MDAPTRFQEAYSLHYKKKDLNAALNGYLLTIQEYPSSNEARYSKQQIQNILKVLPEAGITVEPALSATFDELKAEEQNLLMEKERKEVLAQQERERVVAERLAQEEQERALQLLFKECPLIGGCLAVNVEEHKWSVLETVGERKLFQVGYDFCDLLGFELSENGKKIDDGSAGTALVGALLFGVAGAVIGGSASREVKEMVSDLHIRLIINDAACPQRKIQFLQYPLEKGSRAYREALEKCEQTLSALQFIVSKTKMQQTGADQQGCAFSVADEILKFKKLMDDGIITADEFETQKRKLLN